MSQAEPAELSLPDDQNAGSDACPVYDRGRVTIPAGIRERQGIEDGALVNVHVVTEDGGAFLTTYRTVYNGGFRIPEDPRGVYEIEDGDHVDITVVHTGYTNDDA